MDYLFIWDGAAWWLKLTSAEQIMDYHKKTSGSRYEGALKLYMQHGRDFYGMLERMSVSERIQMMENRDFKYLQCAVLKAEQVEGTIFDGFRCLNMEIGTTQLAHVREHGAVFVNKAGGHTYGIETVQFVRRKELVFPDFKETDIRIKQFTGGCHWYAYIGDMQVRDGGQAKWNTREMAWAAAEKIVSKA